jgi:hypothetical protein
MKIIDFERKGNVVRFYLGEDNLAGWYGDDWNDAPYEHNAGLVYDEYIKGTKDIAFPFDTLVLEPQDDWHNCGNSAYCKNDMIARRVPCLIVVPTELIDWSDDFSHYVVMDGVKKIYFGDDINSLTF